MTGTALMIFGFAALAIGADDSSRIEKAKETLAPRPWVAIRGVYGGYPQQILNQGKTPQDYGINAIWVGSGGLRPDLVAEWKKRGVRVFAEFNTMHDASYLKDHPDAAPIGPDGQPSPAPNGWQGVSPTHPGYRKSRMDAFRKVLEDFDIDGIWLDYHHAHASWEQAVPEMPDTDFSARSIKLFQEQTGVKLPADASIAKKAELLLGQHRKEWTQWRCDVFTDWVREFREIRDQVRPQALLGTFHCPWSQDDYDGAIRDKLAIDLQAQAKHIDVFSIMPYHARFGHHDDPAWISRQTAQLGKLLGIEGKPDERLKIWPIVQLSDWGETVAADQVSAVLDHGTRLPSTGVMTFVWGSLHPQTEKVENMGAFYRAIQGD